ncbi:MAG: hypothetical protein AAF916_12055 [Planctomycetota bacterium]
MSTIFPPSSEQEIFNFGVNATSQLETKGPAVFGLSDAQASQWVDAINAYNALYTECENPTLRTPSKLESKRLAKAEWFRVSREMINIVQSAPTTTDTLRRDLRVNVRDVTPTAIPRPERSPVLNVTDVFGRVISITLREREANGDAAERRAKPAGVKGAALYYATGDTAPTDLQGWTFVGNVSRTNTTVTVPESVTPGTTVFLTAQWFNPRLETGPGCPPVQTIVNFGGNARLAA